MTAPTTTTKTINGWGSTVATITSVVVAAVLVSSNGKRQTQTPAPQPSHEQPSNSVVQQPSVDDAMSYEAGIYHGMLIFKFSGNTNNAHDFVDAWVSRNPENVRNAILKLVTNSPQYKLKSYTTDGKTLTNWIP